MPAESSSSGDAAIAIVGIAGLFPGGATLEEFWDNVCRGVDSTSEVPSGRWLIDPTEAFDSRIGQADRVYSTRGGFVPPNWFDPGDLQVDGIAVSTLDPVFQLALHVARAAWGDAATERIEGSRAGVILGNIVLPVQTLSGWSREVLASAFEREAGIAVAAAWGDRACERVSRRSACGVCRARPGFERAGLHAGCGLCHVALWNCAGLRRASRRQSRRHALRRRVAA